MNNIHVSMLVLIAGVRVRTSEGEASFLFPEQTEDGNVELRTLGNDFGSEWVKFPKGTSFATIASIDKTDSYALAVQLPTGDDGVKPPIKGIVLRKAGYEQILGASERSAWPTKFSLASPAAGAEPVEADDLPAEAGEDIVPQAVTEEVKTEERQQRRRR
jgi:hypothetical protein